MKPLTDKKTVFAKSIPTMKEGALID